MPDTTTARAAALASKAAAKALREAQRMTLPDHSLIYPDTPPGVGWVLEIDGYPKKYLRNKEEAVAHWTKLTGRTL